MTKSDARAIASGLFPSGQDVKSLTAEGRDEVREAVDALLRAWDRNSVRLQLALEQLDKGADDNERLRATLKKIADMCPATCELTLAHEMADNAIAALNND